MMTEVRLGTAEAVVGEMDGNWFRVRGKAVGFRFTAD